MRLLFILSFAFILYSCADGEEYIIESDFQSIVELESRPIEDIELYCVSSINAFDTLLVLVENCDSTIFHAYHISTFDHLGSFGTMGDGPQEFKMPDMQNQLWNENDDILGVVADFSRLKTYTVDISQSLIENKMQVVEEHHTNPSAGGLLSGIQYAGNVEVVASAEGTPGLLFYNEIEDKETWIEDFPSLSKPYSPNKSGFLYNSVIRMKPDGTRLVRAMDLFHRIDIYTLDGTLDFSINLKQEKEPDFSDPDVPIPEENRRYYVGLHVTNKYIYALNWNMTFGQFHDDEPVKTQLEVFNWDGEPVSLYKFDQKVAACVVDEMNKRIIGINDLKENPFIYYQMGDELELLN